MFIFNISGFSLLLFLGLVALDAGDWKNALKLFEACWHLRQQCLYRNHKDLNECGDAMAKCYSLLGKMTCLNCSHKSLFINISTKVGHCHPMRCHGTKCWRSSKCLLGSMK